MVCPACGALLFAEKLKTLAAMAEAARVAGKLEIAREQWRDTLRHLPPDSQPHMTIDERIADLTPRYSPPSSISRRPSATGAAAAYRLDEFGVTRAGWTCLRPLPRPGP